MLTIPRVGVYFSTLFLFSHRHNTSHLQYKREHDNFFRLKLTSRFHLSTRVIALCCLCVTNFESQLFPSFPLQCMHDITAQHREESLEKKSLKYECKSVNMEISHMRVLETMALWVMWRIQAATITPQRLHPPPQHINNASPIIDTLIMVWMLSRLPSCCLCCCVVAVYYSWECVIKRKREINNVSDNEIRDVLSSCKRRTYIQRESPQTHLISPADEGKKEKRKKSRQTIENVCFGLLGGYGIVCVWCELKPS